VVIRRTRENTIMQRTLLPGAFVLAALLGLLIAAPVSAAITGTTCGRVTAFTAPTVAADGSITIDGTAEVIDSSASGAIDAGTRVTLTAVANADATTCLDVTANAAGEITDLDVASQARICGTATANATTGVTSVSGVALPTSLLTAGSAADAFLDAAARAGANVCVDVTVDGTTGLITSVGVSGTVTVCGDVTATAGGNAAVNGVAIDPALTDADAEALLKLAARADGTACATLSATSAGGNTTVGATVTIDVCANVTAVTDNSVTAGGVTFGFAGASDADIQVGDRLCFEAATAPTGNPVITAGGGVLSGGGGPGAGALPDTALGQPAAPITLGVVLLLAAGIGISAVSRLGRSPR
jgi:hypothetical protein